MAQASRMAALAALVAVGRAPLVAWPALPNSGPLVRWLAGGACALPSGRLARWAAICTLPKPLRSLCNLR